MNTLKDNGYSVDPSKVSYIGRPDYLPGSLKRFGFDIVVDGQSQVISHKDSVIAQEMHDELFICVQLGSAPEEVKTSAIEQKKALSEAEKVQSKIQLQNKPQQKPAVEKQAG